MSPDYHERRQSILYLKKQGRHQEALDQVLALQAEGVETVDLAVNHADTLARLLRAAEALEVLENARLRFPRLPLFGRALLAGLLQGAGRLEEARLEFDQLAGEPELSVAVARRVADFLQSDNQSERIGPMLERLARDEAEWYRLRARFAPEGEALSLLKRGHERFPDHRPMFEDYVVLRLKHEGPEVMASELESLLSLGSHKDSLRLRERLAQSLRELNEPARALELLLECARREPGNGYYLANVGYVYKDLGEPEKALDYLARAIELRPNDRCSVNSFVKTSRDWGQSERAMELLRLRLEKVPDDRAVLNGFLTACRDAGKRELAHGYISARAAQNKGLWGAYMSVFRAGKKTTPKKKARKPGSPVEEP
ncbi:MAG: hypothetical protein AMXMBFR33_28150 [Candidatus Xenobia bacterium]